jgi:hypothetical protein
VAGFGADVIWRRGALVKEEYRVQLAEIAQLARAIGVASAKEETTVTGEMLLKSVEFSASFYNFRSPDIA